VVSRSAFADPRRRALLWTVVAIVGWAGVFALGLALWQSEPRSAGFDWELVVEAGRRVASGASPYDPALLAGRPALEAVDLFYSYPPPAAQAAAILAGLPLGVSLLLLDLAAVAGVTLVAVALGRACGFATMDVLLPLLAVLPLLFPVVIALLFGNVDVLYPLAYGTILIAATTASRSRLAPALGGIALGAAAAAKVHPGGLGLWFAARGLRERRAGRSARSWTTLAAAVTTTAAILVVSLLVGGIAPWIEYGRVLGIAAEADVVVRANIGPSAQVALLAGLDPVTVRLLGLVVLAIALAVTAVAALRVDDAVLSLAIGATASLVLLPVTWYHYPPALIPFAIFAVIRAVGTNRARRVVVMIVTAGIVASLAAALPVAIWISVGLVLAAVATSRPVAQPPTSGEPVDMPSETSASPA
jgi:hypothetical protein